MPSYTQYKRQVTDADDNIETWITVKGNHIPIMKGQSKEEAVQSFLEKKGKKESSQRENKPTHIGKLVKNVVKKAGENKAIRESTLKTVMKPDIEKPGSTTVVSQGSGKPKYKVGDMTKQGKIIGVQAAKLSDTPYYNIEGLGWRLEEELSPVKESGYKSTLSEKEDPTFKQRAEILEKMKGFERGSKEYEDLSKQYMSLFPKPKPHIERKRSPMNELVGAAMGPERPKGEKPAKAPKTVSQLKKAASNLESSAAYHYERADRLSDMIKTREKEMENPHITPVMRKSIEKSIGELQLAISKHWVEAGKIEKAEREKQKRYNRPVHIGEAVRNVVKRMGEQRKKND